MAMPDEIARAQCHDLPTSHPLVAHSCENAPANCARPYILL